MSEASLRVLSLGAGVQSTTLALMGVMGESGLRPPDAAVFADTGWEPRAVYEQLDRLKVTLDEAGIPLYRVERMNLRDATLDESRRITIPVFVATRNGGSAPASIRECTRDFKLRPITRKVRELLGYPGRTRVPPDVFAEQWIGFSTDEIRRATGKSDARFLKPRYPLLELGMDRSDCQVWLAEHGWDGVAKSACVGCLATETEVITDQGVKPVGSLVDPRTGIGRVTLLHRSLIPLDEADIDDRPAKARRFDVDEDGDPDGCSPFGCRSGEPVT